MSHGGDATFTAAIEPWKRKADRDGRVISHVVYRDGHASVATIPRKEAKQAAQGELL